MSRIAIDATAFDKANPGSGQYRYAVDLVRGLRESAPDDEFILFGSLPGPLPELEGVFAGGGRWRYRCLAPARGRGGAYLDQVRWAWALRREHVDLLHALHTFFPLLTATPVVVTVYDLMFELFPEYAEALRTRPYRLHRWTVRRRSRRVIAISETTAADLRRLWDVDGARIDVVPLGSDLTSGNTAPLRPPAVSGLAEEPALIVSPYNLEPRKNLSALLRATAVVRRERPDAKLALFGRAAVTPEREAAFAAEVTALGLEGAVVRTGLLDAAALAWLYGRAALFVFPSLYEGFGLPVLEAMAAGACVVARSGSAMAEVVGDAGVLLETQASDVLAAAMLELLADAPRRQTLGVRARTRAAGFSIRRMAEGTLATYRRALAGAS